MRKVIKQIRDPNENEFFFDTHTNIGVSDEFKRLIKFINENSNIEIVRNDIESMEQLRNGSNYEGSSYNLKVSTSHDPRKAGYLPSDGLFNDYLKKIYNQVTPSESLALGKKNYNEKDFKNITGDRFSHLVLTGEFMT